jgi:hypothetical protein
MGYSLRSLLVTVRAPLRCAEFGRTGARPVGSVATIVPNNFITTRFPDIEVDFRHDRLRFRIGFGHRPLAFEARKASDFHDVVYKINQDLQHLYLIGYYSANSNTDFGWRPISVRLPQHRNCGFARRAAISGNTLLSQNVAAGMNDAVADLENPLDL